MSEYENNPGSATRFAIRAAVVLAILGAVFAWQQYNANQKKKPDSLEGRHDYMSVVVREGQRTEQKAEAIGQERREQVREEREFDQTRTPSASQNP